MITALISGFRKSVRGLLDRAERRVRDWTRPPAADHVLSTAADLVRTKEELVAENAFLRHQLLVLGRSVARPRLRERDRLAMVLLARLNPAWRDALHVVKPATLLRWHRRLFKLVWRWNSRPRRRRPAPRIPPGLIDLLRRMARDNRLWGAERIRGELLKLGIRVSKRTIQKYIRALRGPGSPSQTWATFLRNHAEDIWACDLVQAHDILFRPIFGFFIVELASRRVVHAATTRHPSDEWLAQQMRNATPYCTGPRFVIRDNDSKFGRKFDAAVEGAGAKTLRTPVRAPRANAVCERFLGSLRRECLDHVLILGEEHFWRTTAAYVRYFNEGRPHQGLEQRTPVPPAETPGARGVHDDVGEVVAMPVLGGLHHEYRLAA